MKNRLHQIVPFVILTTTFVFFITVSASAQKSLTSVSDDWKQQTANYVVIGYTSNNEDDYIWEEKTNQTQGVHIYVNPSEIVPVFIQQNNNVINFSTRSSPEGLAYTWMTKVKVSVDGGDYFEIYSGSSITDVVWYTSSDHFPLLGENNLKVNITDEFGMSYNREYHIKVIPASTRLYKDNFGNTLRVWEGDNSVCSMPFLFSEGFDAYETNTQEMYYYVAQDLVSCLNDYGYDVYLLDNKYGTQDVKNNATGFNSAVRFISKENNNIPIIAGGVSMGGLISRYGFAKAEDEGNPLPAYVFISVDSPQQGAVVSKSLQDYKRENQSGDNFAEHALNNTAAKQLLNYSTYDPSGEIHTSFYAELNALNGDGYPLNTQKNIGISFSDNNINPNTGKWLEISGTGPFVGTNTFDLEDEEKVAGSYLPIDLTTMDPFVIRLPVYWMVEFLFPIIPLYYSTISIERTSDPTYIPYISALDIVNEDSKFDVTIEPNQTTHHDVLPPDIIESVVTELLLTEKFIQNTTIDFDSEIVGNIIHIGKEVTNLVPVGEVLINNGANVKITGSESIIMKDGVVVIGESTILQLSIDENFTASCGNKNNKQITSTLPNTSIVQNSVFTEETSNEILNDNLIIYPNPTQGLLNIDCNNKIKSIVIFNSNNQIKRRLSQENLNNNESYKKVNINICDLLAGMYILEIKAGEHTYYRKLIIK